MIRLQENGVNGILADEMGLGKSYRAGFNQGKKVAEDIWADYGSDCAFIWSFEDAVDAKLDEECPNNSNFCRGARAGGQRIVNNYEKQCLEDTPDECIDLGNAAAEGKATNVSYLLFFYHSSTISFHRNLDRNRVRVLPL